MKIVVAGRGTAGWLSALYAKKVYPESNVTVVYDDNVPIIGVGEGTTPVFLEFMKVVGITLEDLIRNCDGTIKNGIKFTNWKGDGSHYYHGFYDTESVNLGCDIDKCASLSERNKVDTLNSTQKAVHFDAKKLAQYLEKVGTSMGICTQNGKIEDVTSDDDGYISEIHLDSGARMNTDFIFDCTGFSRLFVSKIFKSPFKSYKKYLPVKRAMPFFLQKEAMVRPYTEAIAMKFGWMWKIPVGERIGCGYVFDSDYVTDEEAYEEICELTGQKPEIRKKISFESGYFTKPFNKNTLAIGLSHGFLEPLEATSLMISILMLTNMPDLKNYAKVIDSYNIFISQIVDKCMGFVHFHYLCSREDTDFWKEFRIKNPEPECIKDILRQIYSGEYKLPSESEVFGINSFITCGYGQGYMFRGNIDPRLNEFMDFYKKCIDEEVEHCKFHDDVLQYCKDSSRVNTASPRV
jgi:tryptophan halogenase